MGMQQDPRYLKNQSRRLHALYGRRRHSLNVGVLLWVAIFTTLFAFAATDRLAGLKWGLADQLWSFLAFATAAPCFWVFFTLIYKLNLAYVRHTYGPDPGGPLER